MKVTTSYSVIFSNCGIIVNLSSALQQ